MSLKLETHTYPKHKKHLLRDGSLPQFPSFQLVHGGWRVALVSNRDAPETTVAVLPVAL